MVDLVDIVLQNWHVNFWNFNFSRFFGAVRLLSRWKTPFFAISAAVKSAKIEISKFHVSIFCVYLQGSCMPIFGSIAPFSRDKIQFFCKKMLFFKRKKRHIIYKGFPSTAKTLPHVFIHNFWTEHFQIKYEYILKTRKTAL